MKSINVCSLYIPTPVLILLSLRVITHSLVYAIHAIQKSIPISTDYIRYLHENSHDISEMRQVYFYGRNEEMEGIVQPCKNTRI